MKYLLLVLISFAAMADTPPTETIKQYCNDRGYFKPAKKKHGKKLVKKAVKKKEASAPDTAVVVVEKIHTVVRETNVTKPNRLLLTAHRRITGVDGSSGIIQSPTGQQAWAQSSTTQSIVPGLMYIRDLSRADVMVGIDLKGEVQLGVGVNF